MEPFTDGVLILLFLWAIAAVVRKEAKEPDPSCHVFFREGDERPMSGC